MNGARHFALSVAARARASRTRTVFGVRQCLCRFLSPSVLAQPENTGRPGVGHFRHVGHVRRVRFPAGPDNDLDLPFNGYLRSALLVFLAVEQFRVARVFPWRAWREDIFRLGTSQKAAKALPHSENSATWSARGRAAPKTKAKTNHRLPNGERRPSWPELFMNLLCNKTPCARPSVLNRSPSNSRGAAPGYDADAPSARQNQDFFLQISQAAPVIPGAVCRAMAACEIRKRHKQV